jgi:hypothetical protein
VFRVDCRLPESNPDCNMGIGANKSASAELSRMLGSVRCIQTLLAVSKSGVKQGIFRSREMTLLRSMKR